MYCNHFCCIFFTFYIANCALLLRLHISLVHRVTRDGDVAGYVPGCGHVTTGTHCHLVRLQFVHSLYVEWK